MTMLSSAFAKEQEDAKHLKVLMIGNSFSICVLKQMPQCAADAGHVLDIASLYIGGCPLEKHWANVKKAGDENFKPYSFSYNYASVKNKADAPVASLGRNTNIPQALKADKWDIVTITYHVLATFGTSLVGKIVSASNTFHKLNNVAFFASVMRRQRVNLRNSRECCNGR